MNVVNVYVFQVGLEEKIKKKFGIIWMSWFEGFRIMKIFLYEGILMVILR